MHLALNLHSSAYAIGGLNESLKGGSARISGPFTPSQWMELEHQALIYKHMVANVPIPSNLLIPLMKSLNPYAFSGLSPGSYAPNCEFSSQTSTWIALGQVKSVFGSGWYML